MWEGANLILDPSSIRKSFTAQYYPEGNSLGTPVVRSVVSYKNIQHSEQDFCKDLFNSVVSKAGAPTGSLLVEGTHLGMVVFLSFHAV